MVPDSQLWRLSRIPTQWSLIREAHGELAGAAVTARRTLLDHYCAAVNRYLLGAVRDTDAADELSQEFALRLLRGDFWRVASDRGRFRDYIKSVLMNLVNDHAHAQRRHPQTLTESVVAAVPAADAATDGPSFDECMRDAMLARTWAALEQDQPRYHAVLLLRVDHTDLASSELAQRLSSTTGTRWTAVTARKTLERARSRFADLLLDEVSTSLDCTNTDDLREALVELDLLKYCRTALARRTASP
jgi:DNA-directed RNA polymerase specialized sigma24 family protein